MTLIEKWAKSSIKTHALKIFKIQKVLLPSEMTLGPTPFYIFSLPQLPRWFSGERNLPGVSPGIIYHLK
jgi:hypothetical protein